MPTSSLLSAITSFVHNHPIQLLLVILIFIPLTYVLINEYARYDARVKGINGPPSLPLIGNIWDIRVNAAEQYRQWSKKYGAVYQVQLGNIPVIVVNSAAAAKVIFGRNSQALASRPEFYTFHKVSLFSYRSRCLIGSARVKANAMRPTGRLEYCRHNNRHITVQ